MEATPDRADFDVFSSLARSRRTSMIVDQERDVPQETIAELCGLASFWSTPAITQPSTVLELCGFGPDDRLVGIIYLGWAAQECAAPERPQLPITHVTA